MAATYDLWQQAYTLATMSGSVSAQQGEPTDLEADLTSILSSFYSAPATIAAIGQWSTVWGPVVFESSPSDTSYADNVMFVAANADSTIYVVGIAGTNPHSKYDIHQEDLDVRHTSTFVDAFPSLPPYSVPSSITATPYLSGGTVLGVQNLLAMTSTSASAGTTLLQYLSGFSTDVTSASTLIFCGHSLAGALAPTLALALFNPSGGPLTLSNWSAVYHYPTAGPTPGNAALGQFLGLVFPPGTPGASAYQVWNANVWNDIDVVPHAWNTTMLEEIPKLYPTEWILEPVKLRAAIDGAKLLSDRGAKTGAGPYEMLPNQSLDGTPDSSIPVKNMDSFEQQALYQHTTAYDTLLGVQSLSPATQNQAAFAPVVHALLTPAGAD